MKSCKLDISPAHLFQIGFGYIECLFIISKVHVDKMYDKEGLRVMQIILCNILILLKFLLKGTVSTTEQSKSA